MGKVTIIECTDVQYIMGRLGLEPRTNRLKAEYSTVELATRKQVYFAHTVYQYNTLFNKIQPKNLDSLQSLFFMLNRLL